MLYGVLLDSIWDSFEQNQVNWPFLFAVASTKGATKPKNSIVNLRINLNSSEWTKTYSNLDCIIVYSTKNIYRKIRFQVYTRIEIEYYTRAHKAEGMGEGTGPPVIVKKLKKGCEYRIGQP